MRLGSIRLTIKTHTPQLQYLNLFWNEIIILVVLPPLPQACAI